MLKRGVTVVEVNTENQFIIGYRQILENIKG